MDSMSAADPLDLELLQGGPDEPPGKSGTHWLDWRTTEVEGRPVSYGDGGAGPTLVFLHGWGLDHFVYKRPLSRLIAAGHRVIAPALPGFAGTARLPHPNETLTGYGDWVISFLDSIGVREPVVLLGHSFGGGVAIVTAHGHQDRVRGLVLINSIGGSAWKHRGALRSITERPIWDWGIHLPADMLPQRQLRRVIPVIVGEAVGNVFRDPLGVWRTAALARSADLTPFLEDLKLRQIPIAVLWGKSDGIVTKESFESMCEALERANVVTVEGGHSWLIGDPDNFGEIMTNVVGITEMAAGVQTATGSSSRATADPG